MGKRLRSIGIQWTENGDDIAITRHAMQRFQKRIERLPFHAVECRIREIIKTARPIIRESGTNDRIYLKHATCVLVLSRRGVIITVYPPGQELFVESIKQVRKSQRNAKLIRRRKRWVVR